MEPAWTTIESDPAVFNELIEKFGVKGVKVEELYGMDESVFGSYEDLHGLLFLFKYEKGQQELGSGSAFSSSDDPTVFFASQVIQNACGTQALLHILCNAEGIHRGETLTNIKEFAAAVPADMRGAMLNSNDTLREAHNSFARPDTFLEAGDDDDDEKTGEAFHFIAYVRVGDRVFEMDGLNRGPVLLGRLSEQAAGAGIPKKDWWKIAKPDIERRMRLYAEEELRFTLLGLVADPRQRLVADVRAAEAALGLVEAVASAGAGPAGLEAAREQGGKSWESTEAEATIRRALPAAAGSSSSSSSSSGAGGGPVGAADGAAASSAPGSAAAAGAGAPAGAVQPLPSWFPGAPATALEAATGGSKVRFDIERLGGDAGALEAMRGQYREALGNSRAALQNEVELREAQRLENLRRRHNFVPLVLEVLKLQAERGELAGLREAGQTRYRAAYERAVKQREDAKRSKASAASGGASGSSTGVGGS